MCIPGLGWVFGMWQENAILKSEARLGEKITDVDTKTTVVDSKVDLVKMQIDFGFSRQDQKSDLLHQKSDLLQIQMYILGALVLGQYIFRK